MRDNLTSFIGGIGIGIFVVCAFFGVDMIVRSWIEEPDNYQYQYQQSEEFEDDGEIT